MHDREWAYRQIFKDNMKTDPTKVIKTNPRMVTEGVRLINMPWHRIILIVKSAIRILGYTLIPFDLVYAAVILIISETINIIEELV